MKFFIYLPVYLLCVHAYVCSHMHVYVSVCVYTHVYDHGGQRGMLVFAFIRFRFIFLSLSELFEKFAFDHTFLSWLYHVI